MLEPFITPLFILLAIVVQIVVLLAVFRLFSIDRTLKQILVALAGEQPTKLSPAVQQRLAQLRKERDIK